MVSEQRGSAHLVTAHVLCLLRPPRPTQLQGLQLLLPWRRPRSAGLRAPVLLRGKVEMTLDDVMASPLVQRALCRMIERALQKRFARLTRVRFVAAPRFFFDPGYSL